MNLKKIELLDLLEESSSRVIGIYNDIIKMCDEFTLEEDCQKRLGILIEARELYSQLTPFILFMKEHESIAISLGKSAASFDACAKNFKEQHRSDI